MTACPACGDERVLAEYRRCCGVVARMCRECGYEWHGRVTVPEPAEKARTCSVERLERATDAAWMVSEEEFTDTCAQLVQTTLEKLGKQSASAVESAASVAPGADASPPSDQPEAQRPGSQRPAGADLSSERDA